MFEVGKSKRKWTCSRISSTRRARTRGCHCPIPPHHQRGTVRWIPSQTKQKFRVGLQRIKDEVRGLIVTLGLVETEILFKYPRGVCNLSSPEREERGHVAGYVQKGTRGRVLRRCVTAKPAGTASEKRGSHDAAAERSEARATLATHPAWRMCSVASVAGAAEWLCGLPRQRWMRCDEVTAMGGVAA